MPRPSAPEAAAPPRAPAGAAPLWQAAGALGLLTVLPLPRRAHGVPTAVTAAAMAPAGLLLGGAAAGIEAALAPVLAVPVRSALVVAAVAGLSGGLHLDGLADTADGMAGVRSPDRRLEIMRDPRVGALGAAAVALVLLVEVTALAGLTPRLQGLVVALTASRAAAAACLCAAPARTGGLAAAHAVRGRAARTLVAVAAAAVTLAVAVPLAGARGLAAAAVSGLAAAAVATLFRRRVGGITGDGCGAAAELALAASLVALGAGR